MQGALDSSEVDALPDYEVQYARELKRGSVELLDRIWNDEETTGHVLPPEQYRTFQDHGSAILASIPNQVLLAIMKGTLAEKAFSEGSMVSKIMAANEKRWKAQKPGYRYQPMIYQQWLCDEDGKAPGVDVIRGIVEDIRRYLRRDGYAFAQQVDTKIGRCPPLKWKEANDRRYSNARKFCSALLATTSKAYRRPLVEKGYTNNGATRLGQHRVHENSNYLLNLVESICRVSFPNFIVRQFVVYHI